MKEKQSSKKYESPTPQGGARFRHVHHYDPKRGFEYQDTKDIRTIPGQGINLKDLLSRYVRYGTTIDPSYYRSGHFTEGEDLDDVDLEKLANEDISVQAEVSAELSLRAEDAHKVLKAKEDDLRDETRTTKAKEPDKATEAVQSS